ncbi:hypothetical protein KW543_15605 [Vibrio fluvialis]|nr:hypothetical protein [Vibrio fluvialis]
MLEINIPRRISIGTVTDLISTLDKNVDTPDVKINFNNAEFATPTSSLLLGSKLRNWYSLRKNKGIRTALNASKASSAIGYLGHLGFFDFLGSNQNIGNKMGQAKGSSTYVPIIKVCRPQFFELSGWYSDIISSVRGLANILAGTASDTEEHRFYLYTLREVVRNVFEHSEVDECFICGQRWIDGRVEIAILDEGVGISSSLSRSHNIKNDVDALKLAIRPGISSTNRIHLKENKYDNSGYGLYVLSEVISSFGSFTIGSNLKRLRLSGQDIVVENCCFRGTYLGIELKGAPKHFSSMLKDIIKSGEQEAQIQGRANTASKMSKLI